MISLKILILKYNIKHLFFYICYRVNTISFEKLTPTQADHILEVVKDLTKK